MIGKLLRRIAEGETLTQQELDALQMLADKVEALTTYSEISQWLDSLGIIRAGEFRSGTSAEPGSGFSGVRIGNPPFTYNSELWNIVGVKNDKLSFGLNADDGSAYAAGGHLTLNENGITVGSSGVAMRLNPGTTDDYGSWYLGGVNVGTSLRFGVHSFNFTSPDLIGEGFESGNLSAWTATGTPYVTTEEYADGDYSCVVDKNNYISITVATEANYFYLVSVKVRHSASTSKFHLTGTGIASGYSPNPILVDTSGIWSKHLFLLRASGTSMTLNFKGWVSGSTLDPIYIDTISMGKVAYSYQGTLLDGEGSYVLAASTNISLVVEDGTFSPATSFLMNNLGFSVTGNISATNLSGTNTGDAGSLLPGQMFNGKISPAVVANDLVLTLLTASGGTPSATDPVKININGTIRSVTAATSCTLADGTNWMALGRVELATLEQDLFAYAIWDSNSSIVEIAPSRYPNGRLVSDFSATTTNEKYIGNYANYTTTDNVVVIGRLAATLSAGAGYTWTVPTYTNLNLILYPVIDTRTLSWNPILANTTTGDGSITGTYRRIGENVFAEFRFVMGSTSAVSGDVSFTPPVTSVGLGITARSPVGEVNFFNSGVASYMGHILYFSSGASFVVRVLNSAGTYVLSATMSSTIPFTWGTSDEIGAKMYYVS